METAGNKIVLVSQKKKSANRSGVIRITPEAETTLITLERLTGLSKMQIASQMIIQGSEFINIVEADEIV